MKQPAVLVVEDDPECHRWLCRCLQVDYHVLGASLLAGAYNLLGEDNAYFDVVILDRVLPDGDGLELLNFLRVHFPSTRILVLSTRDEAAERVRGLTAGADAYLPKPVSPTEVVAQAPALAAQIVPLSRPVRAVLLGLFSL